MVGGAVHALNTNTLLGSEMPLKFNALTRNEYLRPLVRLVAADDRVAGWFAPL